MTTKLIEDRALYRVSYNRHNEADLKHSYCLVSEKAYNYALSLFSKDTKSFEEKYQDSLIEYWCRHSCLGAKWVCSRNLSDIFTEDDSDLNRYDLSKVYLERGGTKITEDPLADFSVKLNHARCISDRSTHFLWDLKKAIAGGKPAYILAAENSLHKENKEKLINLMVQSIILNQLCQHYGIQHRWQPLRTFPKYDPQIEEIHYPWAKFKFDLAQEKLNKWLEYRKEFEEEEEAE